MSLHSLFNFCAGWVGCVKPRHGCFTPVKEIWSPLYRRLGGLRSPSRRVGKIRHHLGLNLRPYCAWRVSIPTTISRPHLVPEAQLLPVPISQMKSKAFIRYYLFLYDVLNCVSLKTLHKQHPSAIAAVPYEINKPTINKLQPSFLNFRIAGSSET